MEFVAVHSGMVRKKYERRLMKASTMRRFNFVGGGERGGVEALAVLAEHLRAMYGDFDEREYWMLLLLLR